MKVAPDFPARVRAGLSDATLRDSLREMEAARSHMYRLAFDELDDPQALKDAATEARTEALQHLGAYLTEFERKVEQLGGHVHWAQDADEANDIVSRLCEAVNAHSVTKSKSMVTEEIELGAALEKQGLEVIETDLGEYIIQLRGEAPSHITAPALHVSIPQVIDAFNEHHEVERDAPLENTDQLLAEARAVLRDKFLNADVGITGANFLIAATGGVVIVTNEGNADLTANLPDTHIVVTGIEKVVRDFDRASDLLHILPRAAVGQRLTNYTSVIHGPRAADADGGPRNFHVVLVDNGRSAMLDTEFEPMLRCIRCAACLNHCPVYTAIGGHAYGSVYPGPMGAVLSPQLAGLEDSRHLPNASTLCGRCADVCPVGIPIPQLLRNWRTREFARHLRPSPERWGLNFWAWLHRYAVLYRLVQSGTVKLLRVYAGAAACARGWISRLPWLGRGWTAHRDFPVPPKQTFQSQWAERDKGESL